MSNQGNGFVIGANFAGWNPYGNSGSNSFSFQNAPQAQTSNVPWNTRASYYNAPTNWGYQGGLSDREYQAFGQGGQQGSSSFLNQVANQQFQANRNAANANAQNFQQAADLLRGVPGRYADDPVNQASRANALALAEDPLTINDETKQMIANRGSNLINAAANTQQRRNMGNLALAGQLGGSSQMDSQQAIERDRFARLGDLASNVEIESRQRRAEDLERSARLGQDVAGKSAGLDLSTAQTLIQNLPQINPEDYSMFLALADELGMGGGAPQAPRYGITNSRGQYQPVLQGRNTFINP